MFHYKNLQVKKHYEYNQVTCWQPQKASKTFPQSPCYFTQEAARNFALGVKSMKTTRGQTDRHEVKAKGRGVEWIKRREKYFLPRLRLYAREDEVGK